MQTSGAIVWISPFNDTAWLSLRKSWSQKCNIGWEEKVASEYDSVFCHSSILSDGGSSEISRRDILFCFVLFSVIVREEIHLVPKYIFKKF